MKSPRFSKKRSTSYQVYEDPTGRSRSTPIIIDKHNNKNKLVPKEIPKDDIGLNCLYSNVDQLLNKMDDLRMFIASNMPGIMLFTEVIPKAQVNPIFKSEVEIGYAVYTNFNYTDCNLDALGGTAFYVREDIKSIEVKIQTVFKDHSWVEIN